ncbi:DUF3870 domain-containing protein [Lentibacillus salicampi]|uniref:DUF3870 domain-containing protein n=1 Tax=Lentibacillus salicampi TaxID=175306 RepID=A0A4Y9AIC5_9BACI|nr:DUF3870 domain-containing protein [Lentibacillus salicampi]TFJ94171.1 DUF3870 domain-containing protein [Lentibacillus salicampi]
MYHEDTVYVVGEAKSPENNPITKQYETFFVGFVIDKTNGRIVDAECTAVIDITKKFVQSLFVGQTISDDDQVTAVITNRYLGSSQKALLVAYRHARKKFEEAFNY